MSAAKRGVGGGLQSRLGLGRGGRTYGAGLGVVTQVTKAKTAAFRFYGDSASMPKKTLAVIIF